MSAVESLRVGWCPGALRPMRVGDGLLVRVKPRANRLTIAQAEAVTAAAQAFGNGILNITGRANLQIRGVSDGTLPGLTATLLQAGLLDLTPEGEAARNVLCSPLAGCEPDAAFDIRPAAAALEQALADEERFHRLPAKFNWTVDDGGSLGLAEVPGDVRFTAVAGPGGPGFRIDLAQGRTTGFCAAGDIVQAAAALADGFLALCAERRLEPHRMADLVAACGAAAILERAGLPLPGSGWSAPPPRSPIGRWQVGATHVVGAAPAFGRLEADALARFTKAAKRARAVTLVLTPWRSLLAADLDPAGAALLLEAAAAAGLVTDPTDRRLAVAACAGEPACRRAGAPVQVHAARWARLVGTPAPGTTGLHVSGCAKGCAHAAPAPLTLVARAGLYDLVRDGRAGDPPDVTGLSVEAVTAMLSGRTHTRGSRVPDL